VPRQPGPWVRDPGDPGQPGSPPDEQPAGVTVEVAAPGQVLDQEVDVGTQEESELEQDAHRQGQHQRPHEGRGQASRVQPGQQENADGGEREFGGHPGEVDGDAAAAGQRPGAADVGLRDQERQPGRDADRARDPVGAGNRQVAELVQKHHHRQHHDVDQHDQDGRAGPDQVGYGGHGAWPCDQDRNSGGDQHQPQERDGARRQPAHVTGRYPPEGGAVRTRRRGRVGWPPGDRGDETEPVEAFDKGRYVHRLAVPVLKYPHRAGHRLAPGEQVDGLHTQVGQGDEGTARGTPDDPFAVLGPPDQFEELHPHLGRGSGLEPRG
jgi:hypothetical protein